MNNIWGVISIQFLSVQTTAFKNMTKMFRIFLLFYN